MNILFIAAYPYDETSTTSLGGYKKITTFIEILLKLGHNVSVLDTSSTFYTKSNLILRYKIIQNYKITYINPKVYKSIFKRFLTLFGIKKTIDLITKNPTIKPDLIWAYNGYAYESIALKYFNKKYKLNNISEFEDWHFSRLKFLNPWPFIDWYYWKKSISSITFGICVNNFLASKFRKNNIKYLIVPGILNKKIFLIKNDPFNNSKITLGYFGGLTNEKGASKIIDLIENTNEYNFIITGSGILSNQFKNLSIKYPNRLKFYGVVDEITLMDLYNKIDIFINFHVIMEGIFPFKIIEALAAGRFIVSSKLDTSFIDIPENILVHSDLNLTQILYTISNIKQNYNKNKTNLKVAQKKIIEEYSEIAIAKKINNILECLV